MKRDRHVKTKGRPAAASSCEIGPAKRPGRRQGPAAEGSAFYKHRGGFRWQGVRDEPYKSVAEHWSRISRKVLIGSRGETTKFHVRYFEIEPGGFSSLESHGHEHVVICVNGSGVIVMGKKKRKMVFMDTVYISPKTVHQLSNPFDAPFGFLCIVNARRDRPKVIR